MRRCCGHRDRVVAWAIPGPAWHGDDRDHKQRRPIGRTRAPPRRRCRACGARSRRGPRHPSPHKPHADKAYDHPSLRRWLRDRGIIPRIARRGIDTSPNLGRYRWVAERTLSWLTGYRRLHHRYERRADLYTAFPAPAATLTRHKRLTKLTT